MDNGNKTQTEPLFAAVFRQEPDEGSMSACTLPHALSSILLVYWTCCEMHYNIC